MTAPFLRHKVPKHLAGFRLLAKLGQGAMAAVFKAHQISMDRIVALKVLAPAQVEDGNLRTRFMREARLAGRVRHQHVIDCFDVGEAEGYLYMCMEFAELGDVQNLVQQHGGALPEAIALSVLRDGARGLAGIHRAGLLHRDIKPANIFICADLSAKLADLGVAKDMRRATQSDQTNHLIGTPAYMSPEQVAGGRPDTRSDIYALGATLYHITTGRLPFPASSAQETLGLIQRGAAPDPALIAPHLSPALLRLIRRTMAREPRERPATALELVHDVESMLGGGSMSMLSWTAVQRILPPDYRDQGAAGLVSAPP